ncbi:hypothetical protein B7494_g852 [Chlorociboria aeruginascens]|nr:hypothetical protein B7494_g852 [Chlorociboria aeruginascens]
MIPLAPIFKKAYWTLILGISFYILSLIALTNSWLQRHVLYAHKIHSSRWIDPNSPEQFGFAKNQITPFNFTTPDHETIYVWHVMPLGLYAKHESEILQQPSGCAEDITTMKTFQLLRDDPESRLIINSIDYRGFGLSTGSPTEEGLIIDGIAAVDWALHVANIPPERIVILGQSLGTAVATAVAEHYVKKETDFAAVVLVAGFTDLPNLLTSYSIAGYIPILSPLRPYPMIQKLFLGYLVDKWPTESRLVNFVRLSKRLRLFIIHSIDDYEIPCFYSDKLFASAANATTEGGMAIELINKMKARNTIDMGNGAFISTWKAGGNKMIREEIVGYGYHSRLMTYAPVALATLKAFDLDDGGVLPLITIMADDTNKESAATQTMAEPKIPTSNQPKVESDNEDEVEDAPATTKGEGAAKKKKSKRKKLKAVLTGKSSEESSNSKRDEISKAVGSLSKAQVSELLAMNPALAKELGVAEGDLASSKAADSLKKLGLEDIMTGLAASGKNVKDMGSYKFWQTQPVPKFGESSEAVKEGPILPADIDKVPKEPGPLVEGFEWVTMDLTSDEEIKEVYDLLYGHYVEDDDAQFRFNYSKSFLKWALLSPGWSKEWHVGVRASASRKLVAFISAIPVALRVRENVLNASEVNFLCIHKKLRSKRLTPVLIKEITRRCHQKNIWQAIYTAGIVLPKPVSTCRYFHRSIDWLKLNEVNFSPLPPNSKPQYQIRKYALPDHTSTRGLREMEAKDIDAVLDLLKRYLTRFDMAPVFTRDEVEHWLIHRKVEGETQVIWSYDANHEITDFFSFYCLESSVINNPKHSNVRAAYLFYYATETGIGPSVNIPDLKIRLNALIGDALILAKKHKFDVFNALTLQDNCLFLEQQKFGAGDGSLHFYLYNYKANAIAGGVDKSNQIDGNLSGVGIVML